MPKYSAALSSSSVSTGPPQLPPTLDACLGAIIWFVIGYAIAYDGMNPFIGVADETGFPSFVLYQGHGATESAHGSNWAGWWFQYVFAAAATTIVSGAVAERAQLKRLEAIEKARAKSPAAAAGSSGSRAHGSPITSNRGSMSSTTRAALDGFSPESSWRSAASAPTSMASAWPAPRCTSAAPLATSLLTTMT